MEHEHPLLVAYRSAADIVADALTPSHDGADGRFEARRLVRQSPIAWTADAWAQANRARAEARPRPSQLAAYWVENPEPDADDRFEIWLDPHSRMRASVEQLVLKALHLRLHAPTQSFARRSVTDASPDEVRSLARRERSRLLGLVDPAWAGPLGHLAITAPAPFDEIDSTSALTEARRALLARLGGPSAGVWTAARDEWTGAGGEVDRLVGEFDRDRWEFPVETIERAESERHTATAEQLLYIAAGSPERRVAAHPRWQPDYVPVKMWDRSLRLY